VIDVGLVESDHDLRAILRLQADNVERAVSADEAKAQGFVTVVHSLAMLQAMHRMAPSVVARANGGIAGYALAMTREAQDLLPVLQPMFARLTAHARLVDVEWFVMGQICVAKEHRGSGVFDALYRGHRSHYPGRTLVTEIAARNTRSLRAHSRVGFRTIDEYADSTETWIVVALAL
jgi:L-amino acid N-acyltransferase YncA